MVAPMGQWASQTFQDKCADLSVVMHSTHGRKYSDMMERVYKAFAMTFELRFPVPLNVSVNPLCSEFSVLTHMHSHFIPLIHTEKAQVVESFHHGRQRLKLSHTVNTIATDNFDGLVQERRNSIANALELHLSCTKPSTFGCISNHGGINLVFLNYYGLSTRNFNSLRQSGTYMCQWIGHHWFR